MEINILDHRLKVSSILKKDIKLFIAAVVEIAFIDTHTYRFFSFTETWDDYSIVLDEAAHGVMPVNESIKTSEDVWRPLVASVGPSVETHQTSGISKIAKSVITPLADNEISVYCLSTYQTDYVLVKEKELEKTCEVLAAFFRITTEEARASAEVVVVPERIRQPLYKWQDTPRPITHSFTLLTGTFYVSSMDPAMLRPLCAPLLELMFYSKTSLPVPGTCQQHLNGGDHDGKSFFMFMVVNDEVSLILDAAALSKFPPNALFNTTEKWKMFKIGGMPEGLGFDECGIVAMMIDPLADIGESDYYLSTFYSDHTLVPAENCELVLGLLKDRIAQSTKAKDN